MTQRILATAILATLLGACAGAPQKSSLAASGTGPATLATSNIGNPARRADLDWNRKCEIMVMASNEPDKARHIGTLCRR